MTSTFDSRSDENLTKGHSDSSPESPLPDSASPSQSPTSPTYPTPDKPLTNLNGTAEADTSKESVEDSAGAIEVVEDEIETKVASPRKAKHEAAAAASHALAEVKKVEVEEETDDTAGDEDFID